MNGRGAPRRRLLRSGLWIGARSCSLAIGAAVAIAIVPGGAFADDAPRAVSSDEPAPPLGTLVEPQPGIDLSVRQQPVQLTMRPRSIRATRTIAQTTAGPAGSTDASGGGVRKFSPIPTSRRDLAERVTFNIRAGFELDSGPASGEPLRGGAALPAGYSDSRPWILGDAMVGARDILLPSLGAYLLSSFQLDASDALATRAWSINYSDAEGQRLAIKAGYAEWGRDDKQPNQKLWLRGGRQFRIDGGALFAYFDGGTIGYRDKGWNASAFAGRRVALYVDTPRGFTFGATAALDLKAMRDLPIKVSADYLGLALDDTTRQLGVVTGSYEISPRSLVSVRTRVVDGGDGFALGRAGARIKLQPSRDLIVIGDLEHRLGGDVAYDLAAPSSVDVTQIAHQLGVGLAAPIDATTLGARLDYRKNQVEVLVFGRAEIPTDLAEATSADQRGWYEGGAAVAGSPLGIRGRGVWVTAQYTLRQYVRDSDNDDVMGSAFADTSASGLERLHELSGDATLASGSGGRATGRRWRFAAGAFYRIYDFRTPYVEITNEGRAGGRAELQVWLDKAIRAELAAELAEASPVLARELGTLSSIRAAVEARW